MKISQQKKFVRELMQSVQADILSHVYDMPSDWDGIELRWYIADRFERETYPMQGARGRNYRNVVTVTAGL